MRRAFVTTLAMLALAAPAAAEPKQVAYAIVIGNNAPPSSGSAERLQPLRYADDDAVRYYQLFSRMAATRLLVVLDAETQRRYPGLAASTEPPTLANLERAVGEIARSMQADRARGDRPVLYVTFSGHGARDARGEAFLALVDGALTQQTLYDDVLARMPSAVTHLIVDACHAGGVVGVRGGFFDREIETSSAPVTAADVQPVLQATPLARHPNIGVILATTLGQESHEWSRIEAGVFTHELLSGLLGAADVNGDHVVEYTEAQAFVAAANRNVKDPRAIPHVIARPPQVDHNAPLIELSALRGTRLLHGTADALGHFHIELDNGQRYLDAHVEPGSELAIAVPDGVTAFLRTDSREVLLPSRGAIAIAKFALAVRSATGRGSIEASYQDALFSAGYGRAYYQGFVDSVGAVGVQFPAPVARDDARTARRGSRRTAAIATTAVAGGLGLGAIISGIVALDARRAYNSTDLQRPADAARQRFERARTIGIAAGAGALVTGAVAWWLWRDSSTHVTPVVSERGAGVSMSFRW